MKNRVCDMLGIEFPLFAFTHCRDVVVAVSKAGGFGVFGAAGTPPDRLETELAWIDEHIDGMPYGVDLIIPNKMVGKDEKLSKSALVDMVPRGHRRFARDILEAHDIDTADLTEERLQSGTGLGTNLRTSGAKDLLNVAFAHPIKLIANALGVPPKMMLDMGKERGIAVAALLGTKQHAIAQVQAGVDLLVVAGGEAGGHTGQVSTMVLVPEVHEAIQPHGDVPILAAGGIATGGQMAAAMAMGAEGAWCGSVWLTTVEAETSEVVKEKMLAASSSDTVRSRSRTGKHSRQLRSPWTDAWEEPGAPAPLQMPLQSIVSEPPLAKVQKLAASGHPGAKDLDTYWVGQGVGLMNTSQSAGQTVQDFKEEFIGAYERLTGFLED
jgi:NAD(P)H-dependent flavin oxidoreductase YrpB (nitropropane dioxygenase family)